jgi:NAD(P)H-flavin reductase/ferredoxin
MLDWLRPRAHSVIVLPGGATFEVAPRQKLLDAALGAGLAWPHDCRVGSCGSCRCRLKEGRIKALTDFGYTLTQAEIAEGTILACQSVLKSPVVVEITLAASAAATEVCEARIRTIRPLTHDIRELVVELERPAFADIVAGQYLDIEVAGIEGPRSYSLARAPIAGAQQQVSFFIRHVPGGAFTDWLFGPDRTDTLLRLRGPFGSFRLHEGAGRMLCIAGGSGLAPIHAILEAGVAARVARPCTVLFGARTAADLYLMEDLNTLEARWSGGFKFIPLLSAEPETSDWQGARGLVTDQIARVLGDQGRRPDDQAYLCGPPAMVDAGIETLRALGFGDDAIFSDRFLDASTQPGGRAAL